MIRSAIFRRRPLLRHQPLSPSPSPSARPSRSTACRCITRCRGEGDPLVVLHGAYMNIPTMGDIIPKLAETHKVYALEFQGHGRTDGHRPPDHLSQPCRRRRRASWMQSASRRPTSSAIRWAPPPACVSPSTIPKRSTNWSRPRSAYDTSGWQPAFPAMIPSMAPEMFVGTPMEDEWKKLAPNPDGFRGLVEKLIALEHEPHGMGRGGQGAQDTRC